jgi:hypothetical protein
MRKNNTFLILLALMLIGGGAYAYFSNGPDASAATGNSSLSSSNVSAAGGANEVTAGIDAQIAKDTSFLTTVTSLTKIKINTAIFSNEAFNSLEDNTVALDQPNTTGRPNPFAPINTSGATAEPKGSTVTTNQPVQVTSKSAILNGTTNLSSAATSAYFEYGPTPLMEKTTTQAKQSLIGTFVSTVNGLFPKTTYYFRAVVKTGGQTAYGDTISFTTN